MWPLATITWSHTSEWVWLPWCRSNITLYISNPRFYHMCPYKFRRPYRPYSSHFPAVPSMSIPYPKMSQRYFISAVSCNIRPERVDSFRPLKSLFLVNGTITIYCGLTDSQVLSHHCCTILKASWKSSETVFGSFSPIRIAISFAHPSV